jgi:hypothetical protein
MQETERKMMTDIAELTQSLLDTYQSVLSLQATFQQKKLMALRQRKPVYELFDIEHPYYDMSSDAKQTVKQFEVFAKGMMDVAIDGHSIRNELEMLRTFLLMKDEENLFVNRLLAL